MVVNLQFDAIYDAASPSSHDAQKHHHLSNDSLITHIRKISYGLKKSHKALRLSAKCLYRLETVGENIKA